MISPTKPCHLLNMAKTWSESHRRKIKNLSRKNRRLKKRICSLQEILTEMKKKALISPSASDVLKSTLPGPTAELLKRVKKNQISTTKYSLKLRSFALTLQFYSEKAYKFVRKMFNTCLPLPLTIKKWYQAIEGSSARY
ncbi:unnamed protein product [Larinioides sclopetarius]|uniref:THAP9-like helix-turn-helix domain-containing protein n=1 Tax=Larinioides sclopetarius TaxID=280406 RepID=A0AAV2AM88_9ARAC